MEDLGTRQGEWSRGKEDESIVRGGGGGQRQGAGMAEASRVRKKRMAASAKSSRECDATHVMNAGRGSGILWSFHGSPLLFQAGRY